eukprot:4924071-Amphidinium_carterae.1
MVHGWRQGQLHTDPVQVSATREGHAVAEWWSEGEMAPHDDIMDCRFSGVNSRATQNQRVVQDVLSQ